jgi:hypothetical protein
VCASSVIQDGEIINANSDAIKGLNGGTATVRGLEIHEMWEDGLKIGKNATVEGCWIHHVGRKTATAHGDGIQISSLVKGSTDTGAIIRENFIDVRKD